MKLGITVGHVEAGLRSFDRTMPEEINRVMADHVSDLLFAPTDVSARNLRAEGLPEERISVTGNTIVDAVRENLEIATGKSDALAALGLRKGGYILTTLHRQENVDSRERLIQRADRPGEGRPGDGAGDNLAHAPPGQEEPGDVRTDAS